tara:strand:- start:2672 stop:2857 length:186 start_codon:yes stop_codon:yes gene_type:complete
MKTITFVIYAMTVEKKQKTMNNYETFDPWERAYRKNKDHYTREEVEEMTIAELIELNNQED